MVNVQSRYYGQAIWHVSPPLTVQAAQTVASVKADQTADQVKIEAPQQARRVDLKA